MRKKLLVAAVAGLMALTLSMPVFAGEWKQDGTGWWYQNDDGGYPNNGWTWVDGRCYYFTPEGYCLINTQTPDGYMVDASGAWIVDGVVQTQDQGPNQETQASVAGVTVQMDNMTFTAPDGFVQDTSETGGVFLYNEAQMVAIVYVSESVPELAQYQDEINSMPQSIMDRAMEGHVGTLTGKKAVQVRTGVWYRYDYSDASYLGIPVSMNMNIYVRINGTSIQMMMFAGNLSGMDTDAIMSNNLR